MRIFRVEVASVAEIERIEEIVVEINRRIDRACENYREVNRGKKKRTNTSKLRSRSKIALN